MKQRELPGGNKGILKVNQPKGGALGKKGFASKSGSFKSKTPTNYGKRKLRY